MSIEIHKRKRAVKIADVINANIMINSSRLNELVKILNENKIVWGIGGSYLLYVYGLYDNPNDLDIWIEPSDMQMVKKLFCEYEEIETNIQLPKEFHLKIKYFEIEVDFVSCFIVTPNKYKFSYYISPETIKYIKLKNGQPIPCTLLEDWYIIYKLLHRESKAKIIEKVFAEKRIPLSNKMMQSSLSRLDNTIQKRVIKDANKLIGDSVQYSIWDYMRFDEEKMNDVKKNASTKIDCE